MLPHLFGVGVESVYLEQSGMQQQSVGGLGVVVTLVVEVTQLVQVPGRKQQRLVGHVEVGQSYFNREKVNSTTLMCPDSVLKKRSTETKDTDWWDC